MWLVAKDSHGLFRFFFLFIKSGAWILANLPTIYKKCNKQRISTISTAYLSIAGEPMQKPRRRKTYDYGSWWAKKKKTTIKTFSTDERTKSCSWVTGVNSSSVQRLCRGFVCLADGWRGAARGGYLYYYDFTWHEHTISITPHKTHGVRRRMAWCGTYLYSFSSASVCLSMFFLLFFSLICCIPVFFR